MRRTWTALATLLALGCGKPAQQQTTPPPTPKEQALLTVKAYISQNLGDLYAASVALQGHAPAPDDDGWNSSSDAAAVAAMKDDWKRARTDYEHIEGAIAVLFADKDLSTDDRYDGFLATWGPDTDLFDDQDVTGIHAIERILWSDSIPSRVVDFESGLPGYQPAAFPTNRTQATEFHDKLCARLISDVDSMRRDFKPLALDPGAAYRGVIGSMREQLEKAEKAAGGEEESRYAQYTLADMRTNVQAGVDIYAAFKPWLLQQSGGADLDAQIAAGFARVQAAYAKLSGDALPPVPATWSSSSPSDANLQTEFGQLWTVLHQESDPNRDGSLVQTMNKSADALGIPQLR